MPNFTQIGQTVWISIRYEQIYIYIFCALYIRLSGASTYNLSFFQIKAFSFF
jgi:hypothetical protein